MRAFRRIGRAALFVAGPVVAILITTAATATEPPLRAMRWLPADSDRVALLTRAPAECLAKPASTAANTAANTAIETGRAAFRTPLLLGGQAARAGLSCDSCHRNGRGNPAFAFPGISGAPGTADVTAALFSKKRGDGIANPKPIPDLAAAPRKIAPAALPAFVTGQIVEEFDGAPPPAAVLAGLVAYLNALDVRACPSGPAANTNRPAANTSGPAANRSDADATLVLTAAAPLADANRAITAARAALAAHDTATAAIMVLAARAQLGLLDERFPADLQRPVRAADTALAAALTAIRANDPRATAKLTAWQANAPALTRKLTAAEPRSLYNPARLAAAIAATAGSTGH